MTFPVVETEVSRIASVSPQAIAVVDGQLAFTYQDLLQHADAIASQLKDHGVKANDLVAVRSGRGFAAIAAMLAIWRCSAGYMIIDPSCPPERAARMIAIAKPRVVLTPAASEPTQFSIDSSMASQALTVTGSPAYAVFTSGSTGKPKAVLVGQESLAWHASTIATHFSIRNSDRVLHAASLSFDVAAEEIWPSLTRGATVVVLQSELSTTPYAELENLLQASATTICNLPASYFAGWANSSAPGLTIPSLRLVIAGSEALPATAARKWLDQAANPPLINAYGTSETTITCVTHPVHHVDLGLPTVPIGNPLPGVQTVIVDATSTPVDEGTDGTLLVSGPCLATEYLHEPELTKASFVILNGQRWYRTGDRVRSGPDGHVFRGRVDDQIKLRGRRIEPAEIAEALVNTGLVTDVRVFLHDQHLVACVCADPVLDETVARSALATRLPDYMIPTVFINMEKMPHTPGGKIDEAALRAVAKHRLSVATTASAQDLISAIVDMCQKIMPEAQISSDSDFFASGGTSLLAAKLASAIYRRYGVPIALEVVFAHPALADLAKAVEELLTEQETAGSS